MSNLSISHPDVAKRAMANGSNLQLEYPQSYTTDSSTVRFDVASPQSGFPEFTAGQTKESPNLNETSSYRQQQMPNMNLQNNLNAGKSKYNVTLYGKSFFLNEMLMP